MKNQQSYRFTRFALGSYQSGRVELVSPFAVDGLNYSPSEFIPSGGTARSLVIGFLRGEKNIPKLECDDSMYLEQEALNFLARDLPSEVLEVVDLLVDLRKDKKIELRGGRPTLAEQRTTTDAQLGTLA